MKNQNSANSQIPPNSAAPLETGFSPWQRLKNKRISYLTVPLIIMATVVEFVILATGWKYQQVVCLPQGMGVTFLGIGPIGATILAVELLKLPLAIWTASRHGWQKWMMLTVGLPLVCVLTFQLVKDMAVYEMGIALTPASRLLEQAATEEIKIAQLNGELAAIEEKKADRERKLAELAAKQARAKTGLGESLQRNEAARQDAITLTDYQTKELSEVAARQATIIQQFATDTEQLTKAITDLRARRETELARATKDSVGWEARKTAYETAFARWHTEEARIDNEHQKRMAAYANEQADYERAKANYAAANILKRQFLKEPVAPGVPPVREANKVAKPAEIDNRPSALVAEFDEQIKAKEVELAAVNNRRRDRIAQVDADAHRLREEFDRRSSTKREETDRRREELSAAHAVLATGWTAEEKQIDQEFQAALQKVEGIRAEVDGCRKKAEGLYEAREAAIKNTQVHRIATTVEIVRGLVLGERPVSIKTTARERGDLYTDQISMVRIWVYPVLAFIVAFLPTLMVEVGFSTVFMPEQQRPPHRLGFFGRRLHWLYTRAGRQKILRAERMAREASAEVAVRDEALAEAKATAEKLLIQKAAEVQAARAAIGTAAAGHEEQMKQKEAEWVAKLTGLADSLNHAVVEKDALRDLQHSEIERQIQQRQNAWSDRLARMGQELDDQRAASEAERTALLQEHHKKLLEVSEDYKTQVIQAQRQTADAELAAVETTARLAHDLKEALHARDAAEAQLQQQADSLSLKLAQAQEAAARELEKAARQEKHRLERQQLEFGKTLRQREADFEHQLKQREQGLSLDFDARLAEEQTRIGQEARRRQAELERELEARALEVDARWKQETQQREEAAQIRLKQREQQLQTQAEVRLNDLQTQAEQEGRRRELDWERQLEARSREADMRLKQELQQKELAFQAKFKEREQELAARADARETELQSQWAVDCRVREEEWERQAESRVGATKTRLAQEAQQREELFQSKSRQRDQQWQGKLDAVRAEMHAQTEQVLRRRELEADAGRRELEARLRQEMQQNDETALAQARQQEQDLVVRLTAQAEARQVAAQAQWETEAEKKVRAAIEPFKAVLARTEKERDEARQSASEAVRKVQHLEEKLTEASSFLNGWKNGSNLLAATR